MAEALKQKNVTFSQSAVTMTVFGAIVGMWNNGYFTEITLFGIISLAA